MTARDPNILTVAKLGKEFLTSYQEALTDYISDVDLASLLIDSKFYAIREAEDQELFFATSNYLDEFLLSVVPSTVSFDESRIGLWAKEALAFARNNVTHDSFVEIFSSRLQYDSVLQGLLRFDVTGRFVSEYFRQVRIDSAYFGDALPRPFQAAVQNAAREAIRPALINLAYYLKAHQKLGAGRPQGKAINVNAIRKSPSFLNEKGTISFSESNGKFRIDQSGALDDISQYQPLIDRAIRKLVEARTFQRIDNKDRILATLLSEYKDEICRPVNKIRIPVVWTIGMEVESRIGRQKGLADKDERLDEDDLFDLDQLLVSHNLFLNCFSQTTLLLKNIEASAAIYRKIDSAAKALPRTLLRSLSENEALVEQDTAKVISRSISDEVMKDSPESKGAIALRLGLLRGLLHAAGGHLLGGAEKIISKAITDLGSKALVDLMRAEGSFAAAIAFLHQQASALLELSNQMPVYFGYIRPLLALFGINL